MTDFPFSGPSWWEDQATGAKCGRSSGPDVGKYSHLILNTFIYQSVQILVFTLYFSKKEKKDVEDLEVPETKRLFMEQNTLDAKKSKEQKEYLDALNKEVIWERSNLRCCSAMVRHNTDLLGSIDDQLPDEEVRKHLLELNEELHDEKREALAVFNNKVETQRQNLHAVQHQGLRRWDISNLRMLNLCILAFFQT